MARFLSVVKNLLLLFLIGVLITTGLGKLLDVAGFRDVIATYQFFPSWAIAPVAITFVVAELRLAEWLITSKNKTKPAFASVLLHVAFTFWAAINVMRGLDIPNCGCFGVFWARPLTWSTVFEDVFMTGVSVCIWRLSKRGY